MSDRQEMINTLVANGNHSRLIVERWNDELLAEAIALDAQQAGQQLHEKFLEMTEGAQGV